MGSKAWATTVFVLLVIATAAAFAWSQRLKRDPLVIDRVTFGTPGHRSFTPNGDCKHDRIRIRFRTTQSDRGTVQVVKPGGRIVLTLDRDTYLKRYTFHTYWWDGRERSDGVAPPGRYKLRVKLLGLDRVLVAPGAIKLHLAARQPGFCSERAGDGR